MRDARGARLALVAVLASMVLAVACGFGADQPTGRLGETLTAGDYQVTATGFEPDPARPDRFTNPKPGTKFVKVHVRVANTGPNHLPVAANYFTVRDSAGTDTPARDGGSSDWALRPTSLGPGQNVEADLYFEIPGNVSAREFVFAPTNIVGWRTRVTVTL
jgi:hypothetical protein